MITNVKRRPQNGEKKFANYISNKGFVSKIHKNHNLTTTKKTTNLLLKQAKDLNSHFSEEDIQWPMSMKSNEKMFNIINHQRNSHPSQMRYYFTPIRLAIIKKQMLTSVGVTGKLLEPSHGAGGSVKWYSFGKQTGSASKC